MKDADKSRVQLLDELAELRRQLEVARAEFGPDEQALHPSEIMLESIVRSVPDIIYRLDIHGNIVFINDAIKTYGYDPEDLIGTNIFELVHPEDREKATYKINEKRTGDRSTKYLELRLVARDHTSIPFEFKSSRSEINPTLLVNAEGIYQSDKPQAEAFLYTQGVARDITERKWAEEVLQKAHEQLERRVEERTADLRASNQQLQKEIAERKQAEEALRQSQKMEAIGQLTAGIAHNFNNMLQGITSSLDLVLQDVPEHLKPFLGEAQNAAHKSGEMVQQLMMYSHQGLQPEHHILDIGSLVRETVDICRKTFDRKIDIAVRVPAKLPAVSGNHGQLEQVLLNLYLNARDALEDVSRAPSMRTEVDVVERAEDEIPSSDNTPGSHIRIRVIDNGTGMDQETQKRIFEPFFTTKEVGKGTGLGLSTVFGTVRQHRGWIECESEAGAGSTFLIYLPIAIRERGEEEQVEVESIPRGTETILIIEDEKMVRRSTMLLLERCGYTVLWGADGLEGLEVFQRRRDEIALVLLDLSMPRMSGQEILEQLQRIESGVKVIIFTGYAARKDQFKGAVDLIQKPFAIETLARKIRAALDH